MSGSCSSYVSAEQEVVRGFSCPLPGGEAAAVFCCGFRDHKYCCDDPHSFFPYEHSYMWWLSVGALVGLSTAAVVLLAFIVTACVLCYLFISSKPHMKLDPGLSLATTGAKEMSRDHQGLSTAIPMEVPGANSPRQSYSLNSRLESNERLPVGPRCPLQHHFMALVTASNIPGSPEEASVPTPDPCGSVP
ncbi:protein shisa-like-2A [Microtus oregoni]|uniref:protein shisa-like-2A n=1 Tax=Microtus oregoni TaxID=111838 RepID=UPI001BB12180|nr:protein shisa-like-2A [Microtus oregoni]